MPQNQWVQVASAKLRRQQRSAAQITSFSWLQVDGLLRNDPVREWEFRRIPGSGQATASVLCDDGNGTQVGGLLEKIVGFGTGAGRLSHHQPDPTIPADGRPTATSSARQTA